jgi:hypothetical protein
MTLALSYEYRLRAHANMEGRVRHIEDYAWFAARITGWAGAGSFSAWGVTRNFTGLLVVLWWPRVALSGTGWSLLGMLVFELVALVRHVIVVQDV